MRLIYFQSRGFNLLAVAGEACIEIALCTIEQRGVRVNETLVVYAVIANGLDGFISIFLPVTPDVRAVNCANFDHCNDLFYVGAEIGAHILLLLQNYGVVKQE